jgi:hypothetical protein
MREVPTNDEIDALFSVNASLNDAISNNDHFMMMKQRTSSEIINKLRYL